jgi:hypothetical protein
MVHKYDKYHCHIFKNQTVVANKDDAMTTFVGTVDSRH